MKSSVVFVVGLMVGCSSSSAPKTTVSKSKGEMPASMPSAGVQSVPTASAAAKMVHQAEPEGPSRPGAAPLPDTIAPRPSEMMQADVTYSPGFDVMHSNLDKLLVFTAGKGRLPAKWGVAQGNKVVEASHLGAGLAAMAKDPHPEARGSAPYRVYVRAVAGEFPKAAYLILDRMNPEARPSRNLVVMHWNAAANAWVEMKNHTLSQQTTIPPFDGIVHWEMPPEPIHVHVAPFALEPVVLAIAGRGGMPTIVGLAKGDAMMYPLAACKKDCVVHRSISFAHKECKTLLDPAISLTSGGSYWVFGTRCIDGAPALESFASDEHYIPRYAEPGTFVVLPSNLDVRDGVVLEEKTDIVVVGSRIARWNGHAWTSIARPPEMDISVPGFSLGAVAATTKGTLWFADRYGQKVWRRKPDGSWAWLSLPKAVRSKDPGGSSVAFIPWDVHVNAQDDVWVTGCLEGARFDEDGTTYEDDDEEKAVKADCGAYFVKAR